MAHSGDFENRHKLRLYGTIIRTSHDEIVLCWRAISPACGRWVPPGGYVDRGEELRAAAARVLEGVLQVSDDESLEVGTFSADTIPRADLAFSSARDAFRNDFASRDSR
ncbi:MAG: NUDIX domain-containing protein [Acidobacteriota bacterium]